MSNKISRAEVAKQISAALKEKLSKFESDVQELKAREGSTKVRKLEKHELCPLCGGPDINAVCDCLKKGEFAKNALMGYGPSTPGSATPSDTGMGSMGGGGTQPMGLAEKTYKNEMCKNCGYAHEEGKHDLKKDGAGLSDVGALSKKTPDGISEKTMHKLKDEYGHDKEGKAKAYATANAIANGTVNHKAEGDMAKHTPGMAAPATSVAQANKEMGGFQSLASNPIHSAQMGGGALKTPAPLSTKAPRPQIASMGRKAPSGFSMTAGGASTPRASVSGTIPNAKKEMEVGTSAKGHAGHASDESMPTAIKDNLGPIQKDEKEMKRVVAAPEKAATGTKMPEAGESVDAEKTGAGGQIKKGKALRKDAMSPAYAKKVGMDVKGVGGKQPVGQGGGDASPKMPASKPMNAKLPKPAGSKSNTAKKDSPLKAAGRAEVKRMVGDSTPYSNPNVKELPSEDVDVSEFDAGQNRLNPFKDAAGKVDPSGGAKMMSQPGRGMAAKPKISVADAVSALKGEHPKVSWLRGLIDRFHNRGKSIQPTGRGMAPAPSMNADQAVQQMKYGGAGQRGVTIPTDSTGGVRTIPADQAGPPLKRAPMTRFHGALPLQRSENPLADLGTCAICNGPEHGGNCK